MAPSEGVEQRAADDWGRSWWSSMWSVYDSLELDVLSGATSSHLSSVSGGPGQARAAGL